MADLGAVKTLGHLEPQACAGDHPEEVVETKRRPRVEAGRELGVLAHGVQTGMLRTCQAT